MFPRALPPSAAPIPLRDILGAMAAVKEGKGCEERFKTELRNYFGVQHCYLASTGRGALSNLLRALHKLSPNRNEVAVPAYTSYSVPSAVVNAGLKVALYDLDPSSLSPDLSSVRQAVTEKTLCIVGCHLYGYVYDIGEMAEIAAEAGVPLIDDAAQAMGAVSGARYAGTFGRAGIFSLSRGKNITAVDGGIIVTDDPLLAEAIEGVPLRGAEEKETLKVIFQALLLSPLLMPGVYWIPRRLPFLKLGISMFDPSFVTRATTPFQAALGSRMLKKLKGMNEKRAQKARNLMKKIETSGSAVVPSTTPGTEPVFLRLPVIASGVAPCPQMGIVRSYPASLDRVPAIRRHLTTSGQFAGAARLAEGLLTLPTHQYVTEEDMKGMIRHLAGI